MSTPTQVRVETTHTVRAAEGSQITLSGTGTALDNKVKVSIPPGAIQGQATVILRVGSAQNPAQIDTIPVGRPDGLLTAVGTTVRIEPSAPVTFGKPITVTIPFSQTLVPGGFDPQRLVVLVGSTDQSGKQSWEIVRDIKVDVQQQVLTFPLTHLSDATALAEEGLSDIAKDKFFELIKNYGGEVLGPLNDLAYEPLTKYLEGKEQAERTGEEDDQAAQAAFLKFIEGVGSVTFPQYALAYKAGKVVIGTGASVVEFGIGFYTAGPRNQREILAFGVSPETIVGRINNAYGDLPFWSISAVTNRGISKENIGEKVESESQLRDLWFDKYRGRLVDIFGGDRSRDQQDVDKLLADAWPLILKYWQVKRANHGLDKISDAFRDSIRKARLKLLVRRGSLAAATPRAAPTPTPTPTKSPSVAGTWKLVETKVEPVPGKADPGLSCTVAKNSATQVHTRPTASIQLVLSWDSPPDTLTSGQTFSISIKGSGTVKNKDMAPVYGLAARLGSPGIGIDLVDKTRSQWGGVAPMSDSTDRAWVNGIGTRAERDEVAVWGENFTYKYRVSASSGGPADIYLAVVVGGFGGDVCSGTVTFHWRKSDAPRPATWKMLEPKVETMGLGLNPNRSCAITKDSAAFSHSPPQGDTKGLFYPNTVTKLTWDSPPEILTEGQTFTMEFKGTGAIVKPGQNPPSLSVKTHARVRTTGFNAPAVKTGWNGYNVDPGIVFSEAYVGWREGQPAASADPFWGQNLKMTFSPQIQSTEWTITLQIVGGEGSYNSRGSIDCGGTVTFRWQKQ